MVAVDDLYELAVQTTDASSATSMINVFHLRQKAGFLSAINLIGEWILQMEPVHRPILATGVQITKYSCRSLIPYGTDFYETTTAINGTGGTGTLPCVCAAVITWRTGLPGRRKRGRTYFGGMAFSKVTGGRWASTFLSLDMGNFGNKVLSVYGAGGSSPTTEMGVWSRVLGGQQPPHTLAGYQVITGFTAQAAVASMGTRRFGRGI